MITDLTLNDLVRLEPHAQFPMPNVNSPLYIIKKSVIEDDLLGSFWVKMTTETSLILRPDIGRLKKARAIKEIVQALKCELAKKGFNDSHLFIKDNEEYVAFLKRHFGFEDAVGTALYIRK